MTDQEIIDNYVREIPNSLPGNNPQMREAVHHPNYVDRGMWGPYGGKNGTVSQVWLDEYRNILGG